MSGNWKTLIVDDEPLARRGLERLLSAHPDVRIAGECGNGRDALTALEAESYDLVLLDIEMPELNGFDVLRLLEAEPVPAVIFVTAYDQYAIEAFEAGAHDYLLKPVDPERLASALDRVRSRRSAPSDGLEGRLRSLLDRMEAREGALDRIVVRLSGRIRVVPTAEIDWVEAADNYVRLHVGGREVLHRETLSSLEARLDERDFVRVHRSTLVRFDRIRELRPQSRGDARLVLADGTELAVSRRHRRQLDERLGG